MLEHKDLFPYKLVTGKERGTEAEKDFHNSFLSKTAYERIDPNRTTSWLRPRMKKAELHKPLKYNNHTQSGRQEAERKGMPLMDYSGRNMKMVHDPEWKERIKEKWIDPKDYMCLGESTYEMMKANTNSKDLDPYIDGNEVTSNISIIRKKFKDLN